MEITGKPERLVLFLMQAPKDKVYCLKEKKEKRSLSQNSYYWVLLGKVATKTKVPASVIHNKNLRDLGLVMRLNDELITVYIPDTEEAENEALGADTYHLKPTSHLKAGKNGKMFRAYVMLRGSSTFNVHEMTALLDLMIQEAVSVGVDIISPEELAHIRELEYARENKSRSNKASGTAESGGA